MYTCMHIRMLIYVCCYFIAKLCLTLLWPPWDFPGKNTGVGCHFLLQRVFLTQKLNLCLLYWQADSFPLSHLGSPVYLYVCVSICIYIYIWRESASHNCGGQQVQNLQGSPAGRRTRENLLQSWICGQSGGKILLPLGTSVFFPLKASAAQIRPTYIMESYLLYSESTDLNVNYI